MSNAVTFFVDTNFLLQCKAPDELPWPDVTDADHILLYISRPIQTEIDRFKGEGNSRRARRARKVSSLLRALIQEPGHRKTVRASDPQIEWALPPPLNPSRDRPDTLDLSQADDRLVEAAYAYALAMPDEDVRLLSHDTGPQLSAMDLGLPAVGTPDSWLLPPEPDAASKTLAELQRRISSLEGLRPELGFSLAGWTKTDGPLELTWKSFGPLATSDAEHLIQTMKRRFPLVPRRTGATAFMYSFEQVTAEQQSRYEEDWNSWIDSLQDTFQRLPVFLEEIDSSTIVTVSLYNEGEVPANNLIVEFDAVGFLLDTPEKVDHIQTGSLPDFKIPKAPSPPKPVFSGVGGFDTRIPDFMRPIQRMPHVHDRHGFYWKPERPSVPKAAWRLESDEFRHKLGPEKFALRIRPHQGAEAGVLRARVSASNSPSPVTLEVPIRISRGSGDTMAAFQSYRQRKAEGAGE